MNKAVFLDRDGVINPLVYNPKTDEFESPHTPADFSIYPHVATALQRLKQLGFINIVVSNQPSYAKGKTSLENIQAIERLLFEFSETNGRLIDEYYYCYHHPQSIVPEFGISCRCRKPGTLHLENAIQKYDLDTDRCYFIGDQDADVFCGKNMGVYTLKITNPASEKKSGKAQPDNYAGDLVDAVNKIDAMRCHNRFISKDVSMDYSDYIEKYLLETKKIAKIIDRKEIAKAATILSELKKKNGRLFVLGVGGSAANASHAVNDFRKIAGIEAYAPTDNVAELTARTNDDGWESTFNQWLTISRLNDNDALLILSVGGGSSHTSLNIKMAIDCALEKRAKIIAIVSRDGGYSRQKADACILIPVVDDARITPHAEGWQGVIWHCLVNAIA
jgi:D-sedoheptulose 7-phosphate isomerase